MSHHLTPDQRLEVHRKHVEKNGGTSYRPIELEIRDRQSETDIGPLIANIRFEVCLVCGLMSPIACDHGASVWTHRPGCPKFTIDDFGGLEVPEGLFQPYSEKLFGSIDVPSEDCGGCLLVCPVCRADGT
jgi:hypothetical protein